MSTLRKYTSAWMPVAPQVVRLNLATLHHDPELFLSFALVISTIFRMTEVAVVTLAFLGIILLGRVMRKK